MGTPPPATAAGTPLTPRWQRILAGFSLGIVTFFVATPVALVLVLLWTIVLGIASAQTLDTAGVLRVPSFASSVALAAVVVLVAAVTSVAVRLPRLFRRRLAAARMEGAVRPGRWLLLHPWITAGLAIVVTDVALVPLDRADAVDVHSVLIGTILVGTVFWLIGTLVYGLLRGWALVLGLVWAGVRASSFFAGIVVIGALGGTVGGNLLWRSLTQRAGQAADTQPAARLAGCDSSGIECVRVLTQ